MRNPDTMRISHPLRGTCGAIAGLAFLLVMAGSVQSYAQISPGPLSRAHSMLSGPTHCVDCHDPGKSPPEFKCLDCHKDIRERLAANRGLHPSLLGGDTTTRVCMRCHSEHNGPDFALIHWDRPVNAFDHRRAGYSLEGKHARLPCRDCHKPSNITPAAASGLLTKDLHRTYLGLSPSCLNCHADEHHGQLSSECASCHDSSDWKKAPRFNHARSRFALTGAHEKLACEKCHPRTEDAKPFVKYKGIAFQDCTPCHKDPHRGSFRAGCRSCHGLENWKVTRSTVVDVFNHATTEYPLEGKHAGLACESCHHGGDFKQPVACKRCDDCHKKDPHQGQFANRADRGDCTSCHTVEGFKPATFGLAEHSGARFALKGRHSEVPCARCHPAGASGVTYRFSDISCASCHRDVHGGQFQGAPHNNRCEDCHNDRAFKPSTYTLARHAKTRFPLESAHAALICSECHRPPEGAAGTVPAKYVFDDRSCTSCHADPHQGQFSRRMATLLPDGSRAGCRACHNARTWQEVEGFDHSETAFALEGAHRAVPCEDCHRPDNLSAGTRNVIFKSTPKQCSACHDDIHAGQFSSASGEVDCARCHRVLKWKPSTFNHDAQSSYRLDGAHREVPCNLCHTLRREVAGKTVLFYRPTTRECSGCHGSESGRDQP